MKLLALNFLCLKTLRPKVLFRVLFIPYCTSILAIAFGPSEQEWIAASIADKIANALATPVPNVNASVGVTVMFILLFSGYLVGWLVNMAALAMKSTYTLAQSIDILTSSLIPKSWQRDDTETILEVAAREISDRQTTAKKLGLYRFILRGAFILSIPAFLVIHVASNLVMSKPIDMASLPLKFALWFFVGVLNSVWAWLELRR